jgi:hypothetical protein
MGAGILWIGLLCLEYNFRFYKNIRNLFLYSTEYQMVLRIISLGPAIVAFPPIK